MPNPQTKPFGKIDEASRSGLESTRGAEWYAEEAELAEGRVEVEGVVSLALDFVAEASERLVQLVAHFALNLQSPQ